MTKLFYLRCFIKFFLNDIALSAIKKFYFEIINRLLTYNIQKSSQPIDTIGVFIINRTNYCNQSILFLSFST